MTFKVLFQGSLNVRVDWPLLELSRLWCVPPTTAISLSHTGCKPEQQMMYAGSKNRLVQTAELTKVRRGPSPGGAEHPEGPREGARGRGWWCWG